MSEQIEVIPLSKDRLEDFLTFFDGTAFSDNPKWASCYCQCFYEDHTVVKRNTRTAVENRSFACSRIATDAMQGLLAHQNGVPVGWCGAAPRRLFRALDAEPIPDAESVGAIRCFLVHPDHLGSGVARRFLESARQMLADQGMKVAEANPRSNAKSAAENHFGPLSLYLSCGFHIDRHDTDGSVYVRKALAPTM